MRILLVLTGGTISTVVQGNVMEIHENSPYLIVEKYQEMCKEELHKKKENFPEFDIIEPVRMLSECSRPEYLEQIYYGILKALGLGEDFADIRKKSKKELLLSKKEISYNGIIVTHGSDTLSYSAAFFSTIFSWLDLPFVVTAADYPLSDIRSNGLQNFSDSVSFIKQGISGVFVVWQNRFFKSDYLEPNLYLASEILEADTYSDCFSSYTGQAFGEIRNEKCIVYQKDHDRKKEKNKIVDIHMEQDILFLRPYPGLRYDCISFENTNIKAVVHYLYHSSTAYVEETEIEECILQKPEYNLLAFARYCKKLGIDLYLAGFKSKTQRLYETNELLLKSGLGKPLYHISPEMAYMKVLVAYNQTIIPVEEFLRE